MQLQCIYQVTFYSQREGPVEHIIDTLLKMLEKDVIDNSKACAEYFEFFKSYASYVSSYYQSVIRCIVHMYMQSCTLCNILLLVCL